MRPLLFAVVALTAFCNTRWARAAPQPLSVLNVTDVSGITTMEDASVPSPESADPLSTTLVSSSDSESSEVIVPITSTSPELKSGILSSEINISAATTTSGVDEELTTSGGSAEASSTVAQTSEVISTGVDDTASTVISVESSSSMKPTQESNGETVEAVSISRYVPPLDPMRHMMMMAAEAKKATKIPETVETTEATSTVTSATTEKEITSADEIILKKETISDTDVDEGDKEAAESSDVEEKQTTVVTEKTIDDSDVSTVMVKSAEIELSSEKENETTEGAVVENTFQSTTEKFPTTSSQSEVEITDVSTEKAELSDGKEAELPELRNSELVLESEADGTTEKVMMVSEDAETPITDITYTTKDSIKFNEVKEDAAKEVTENSEVKEDTSIRSSDEIKSDISTVTSVEETTTEKIIEVKTESSTEEEIKISMTTSEVKDSTLSTSTASIPETTFEGSDPSLTLMEEKTENASLEDDLEFRAVKVPTNASKVSYSETEVDSSYASSDVSDPEMSTSDEKEESTASSIFTTIQEFLFPSTSTTEKPSGQPSEVDDLSSPPISSQSQKIAVAPLAVDTSELTDTQSENAAVLDQDPADMLKVQSIKTSLDSVPAEDSKQEISTTTEVPTEREPEDINIDYIKNADPILQNDPSEEPTTAEYFQEGDSTTAKEPESSAEESDFTTTESLPPATTEEIVLKSQPSKMSDSQPVKTVESTSEAETDPKVEEKPSDYGLKIDDRYVSGNNTDMVAAVQFLHYHDKASSEQCFKLVDAHWDYATNLTDENKRKQLAQTLEYSLFHKEAWKNATSFAWKSFNDTLLRRWFKSLSVLGTAALPEDKLNEFNRLKAEMKNTYSTAKVCAYVPAEARKKGQILREKDCNLTLEPDLQRVLTKSRDYDELVHVWKAWRDAAGKPIREKYLRFVNISNEAARLNGFPDTGDMWREAYESETFKEDLERLWEQLKPLYENLHAYVRRKLISQYGNEKIKDDGPIPAHLFGNMWAQSWVSLLDITQPFQGKPSVDVTPIMEAKNMTALEMFKISEEFFTSLGLKAMPEEFWKHSLIEKPKDREIICHASAWDFCNGKDYRIKQCTDITMEDLITVHHEMGHVQYFLQYARQPNVFREGANPGFHEAIGDVLALSVSTPKHLKSIELLEEVADDPEGDLNFLLRTALDKVSFLPSGYLIDLWRWGLFSGDIKPEEMNTKWWELRLRYQGICPPVKRTDTDFDPGAKYHVPGNVPYIRYFVSFVIQFQFHKVLCDAAGHTGPLYKCDIYRSKEAGQILSQVMELGSSEHWSEAMKIMTGGDTNKMDAGPILEYFEPLLNFLREQNVNETLGWKSEDPTICP